MTLVMLVMILRALAVLVFVASMLLRVGRRRGGPAAGSAQLGGRRAPLVANCAAFALFLAALLLAASPSDARRALPLACCGCLLALAGVVLILRSRAALGPAWSLLPKADQHTGLVTTGPYRLVRHPIYLGFVLLTLGEALAFGSGWGVGSVLFAIVPSFAWRARVEEAALRAVFGDRHAEYRRRTKLIIPHVL